MALTLEKYVPGDRDTWQWSLTGFTDIAEIVTLASSMYQVEIEDVFTPDLPMLTRNISYAVIKQTYNPLDEQIISARDDRGRLIAWAWLSRGNYMPYALEEVAEAKFAHVALDLPTRTRVTLLAQILQQWELWCVVAQVPVLVSTSIREEQTAFMRLHREAGYTVRGSYAYKRVVL